MVVVLVRVLIVVTAPAGKGVASAASAAEPASATARLRGRLGPYGRDTVVIMLVGRLGGRQQVLEGGERVAQHLRGRLGRIDHPDALGLGSG